MSCFVPETKKATTVCTDCAEKVVDCCGESKQHDLDSSRVYSDNANAS